MKQLKIHFLEKYQWYGVGTVTTKELIKSICLCTSSISAVYTIF